MVVAGEKDLLEHTQDEVLGNLSRYREFEPLRIRPMPLQKKRQPPLDDFSRLLCTSRGGGFQICPSGPVLFI